MSLPEYFIFTDIGHDIDDALAFVGPLGRLHKDKKIKIVGIVVQLKPTDERVWLMLGLLAAMGITDIPVAHGPATDERPWKLQPYEFDPRLKALAQKEAKAQNKGGDFLKLAEDNLVKKDGRPRTKETRVRVLILTNFQRFMQVMKRVGKDAFKNAVKEIHFQSGFDPKNPRAGWSMYKDAGNNMQDLDAADKFFTWSLNQTDIPCYIYTNQAAMPASFDQQVFYKKIKFENPSSPKSGNIGLIQEYLRNVHQGQCWNYYRDSNRMKGGKNDPVIPGRGRDWYFKVYLPDIYKTPTWDKDYPWVESLSEEAQKQIYVSKLYQFAKVIPYDPIVAMGAVAEVTGKAPAKKTLDKEQTKHEIGSNIVPKGKDAEDIRNFVLEYLGKTFA